MSLKVINKYFHTLRSLKAKQLFFQLFRRTGIKWLHLISSGSDKAIPFPNLISNNKFDIPPVPLQKSSSLLQGHFSFVNQTENINWPPEWNPEGVNKLWQYNLHYHDWLWSLLTNKPDHWPDAIEAVNDWIINHPLKRDSVGWDPYPTSLRIQNWILLLFINRRETLLKNEKYKQIIWASLRKQIIWLEKNLEFHLLGNHIIENAAALVLAGATFNNSDAKRWKLKGIRLLQKELKEQFPKEGMHFENSPMYHLRLTWLIHAIISTNDEELLELVSDYKDRAEKALDLICHPDGRISLLNDSVQGIYNEAIIKRPIHLSGPWSLKDSGYYGWRDQNGNYIICDAGELGPHYIPGHAHADCFNFELSIKGKRVITDTGISDYEKSINRHYIRSTAAHNTVEIDGQNQSEIWGSFRVARKAKIKELEWAPSSTGFRLTASHDGYNRLPLRAIHKRQFEWIPGSLKITDFVSGESGFNAIARFHFDIDISLSEINGGYLAKWEEDECKIEIEGVDKVNCTESKYFKHFGVEETRKCLECFISVSNEARWKTTIKWQM